MKKMYIANLFYTMFFLFFIGTNLSLSAEKPKSAAPPKAMDRKSLTSSAYIRSCDSFYTASEAVAEKNSDLNFFCQDPRKVASYSECANSCNIAVENFCTKDHGDYIDACNRLKEKRDKCKNWAIKCAKLSGGTSS